MSLDHAKTYHLLMETCRERGFTMTGDHRVTEVTAAHLLDKHPGTLRRLRGEGKSPRYLRNKRCGSISYRIEDISTFIVESYSDGDDG